MPNDSFDFPEVTELVEVSDTDQANEHLALGWRLLHVRITDAGGPATHQAAHYIL